MIFHLQSPNSIPKNSAWPHRLFTHQPLPKKSIYFSSSFVESAPSKVSHLLQQFPAGSCLLAPLPLVPIALPRHCHMQKTC